MNTRFHLRVYILIFLIIYSNKKETSDFHGTVSFHPVKMSQQKNKPKCLSNVQHTKTGNYLISSSYLEELFNLKWKQLIPLSSAS